MSATYLDHILEAHRMQATADERSVTSLIDQCRAAPPTRGFREALKAAEGLSVISEIKRRSPSKGELFANLDPAVLAGEYEQGGAACLSVLTDVDYFGGSVADLKAAREAVALPVIRKDFTVSIYDVLDARLMGADAILLIVAALDDGELSEFHMLATDIGLDVLVEAHDEGEVERALGVDATLIGVNQRDLMTFEVDQDRAVRVAQAIPDSVVRVAESGVRGPDDARILRAAGFDAVLVGESLLTDSDPTGAVRALRTAGAD